MEQIFAEYEWLRMLKERKRQKKLMHKYRSIKVPLVVIETNTNAEVFEYEESISSVYGAAKGRNKTTSSSRRKTLPSMQRV
jgi:hypothetical protein